MQQSQVKQLAFITLCQQYITCIPDRRLSILNRSSSVPYVTAHECNAAVSIIGLSDA
jgi:hypothetical protein